ncbi:MAG: hypothetical protein ACRDTM_10695 [Micromonosporaceae bacterium]
MSASDARRLKDHGPLQLADRLGLARWQVRRAVDDGLIALPDVPGSRWSAAIVEAAAGRVDRIREAVGGVPDLGAARAAAFLSDRFGEPVEPYVLIELDRHDLVPEVGEFKGHPLYCGRALERFNDVEALHRAMCSGRLLTLADAAGYLRIRPSDFKHLHAARWVAPVLRVHGPYQRRRDLPEVPLYRVGDLDVLAAHPGIDWDAVRATPPGRPSPLAVLSRGVRSGA